MKMRLIDADELKRQIENALKKQKARDYDLIKVSELPILIDRQPTAYDVDEVVEELENEVTATKTRCAVNVEFDIGIYKAIEIVKAGGLNE